MENQGMTQGYDEAVAYLVEMGTAEREGRARMMMLEIGPYTAFVLIGALQLATRHPAMKDDQRGQIQAIIDQLKIPFQGTPAMTILNLGDDPANDIPRLAPAPGSVDFMLGAPDPVGCPKCGALAWSAEVTPGAMVYRCKECLFFMTARELVEYVMAHMMTEPGQDDLAPEGPASDLAREEPR